MNHGKTSLALSHYRPLFALVRTVPVRAAPCPSQSNTPETISTHSEIGEGLIPSHTTRHKQQTPTGPQQGEGGGRKQTKHRPHKRKGMPRQTREPQWPTNEQTHAMEMWPTL